MGFGSPSVPASSAFDWRGECRNANTTTQDGWYSVTFPLTGGPGVWAGQGGILRQFSVGNTTWQEIRLLSTAVGAAGGARTFVRSNPGGPWDDWYEERDGGRDKPDNTGTPWVPIGSNIHWTALGQHRVRAVGNRVELQLACTSADGVSGYFATLDTWLRPSETRYFPLLTYVGTRGLLSDVYYSTFTVDSSGVVQPFALPSDFASGMVMIGEAHFYVP